MASLGRSVILGAFVLMSQSALAAEYRLDSVYSLSGRYDDNYRLRVDSDPLLDELSGADFSAQWDISRNTGVSRLTGTLDLDAGSYDVDSYNTFDQRLNLSYRRDQVNGSWWQVSGGYHRDSAQTTEQTFEGSGEFADADSRTESGNVNVTWLVQMTERNSLQLGAFGKTYRSESERLSDYDYVGTSALWQYRLTERLRLQAQIGYNEFDSKDQTRTINPNLSGVLSNPIIGQAVRGFCEDNEEKTLFLGVQTDCFKDQSLFNEQHVFSYQAGFIYLFSERLSIDVLYGQSKVETDSLSRFSPVSPDAQDTIEDIVVDRSSSNSTYNASLSYDAENLNFTLSAKSSESANTSGRLTINDRVIFTADWQLNTRHFLVSSASWFEQESVSDGDDIFSQREQWSAQLSYRYRFSQTWTGSASYRYLTQERFGINDRPDSQRFMLGLTWSPSDKIWSR